MHHLTVNPFLVEVCSVIFLFSSLCSYSIIAPYLLISE